MKYFSLSLNSSSTPTDHPDTKQKKHFRSHPTKHNNKWVLIVTSLGGFIIISLFVVLIICNRKGEIVF